MLVLATPHEGPALPRIIRGVIGFLQMIIGGIVKLFLPNWVREAVEVLVGIGVLIGGLLAVLILLGYAGMWFDRALDRVRQGIFALLPSGGRIGIFKIWWESEFWSGAFRSALKLSVLMPLIYLGLVWYFDWGLAPLWLFFSVMWLAEVHQVLEYGGRLIELWRHDDPEEAWRTVVRLADAPAPPSA